VLRRTRRSAPALVPTTETKDRRGATLPDATGEIERFAFAAMKYGVALPADAGRIEAWRGFVTDDRAHQLDFHELLFVGDGRGQIWLDEQRAAIAPGRLLLTPAGRVRRFELDRPLEGFILLFIRGLSQHIAADMLGGRTFRCLSASAPMPVRDETAARIRRLLDDIRREVSSSSSDSVRPMRRRRCDTPPT
jgi:mannose-6-phosphate isomerase-like protein (cupin superfamily)